MNSGKNNNSARQRTEGPNNAPRVSATPPQAQYSAAGLGEGGPGSRGVGADVSLVADPTAPPAEDACGVLMRPFLLLQVLHSFCDLCGTQDQPLSDFCSKISALCICSGKARA